jgi:hypothetical protein
MTNRDEDKRAPRLPSRLPGCAPGEDVGGFVAPGSQDIPILSSESYEASAACWKIVRGMKLAHRIKW